MTARILARRPAVFLDRDGTLNREVDYLSDPADLELIDGVPEALRELKAAGFLLCVTTNQSGIARGMLDEARLAEIHAKLEAELAAHDVALDWIGHCPHHPDHGEPVYRARCSCRKPAAGLYLLANATLSIDLDRSWCVGDSVRDLDAGALLGVPGILVRTGKGERQEKVARQRGRSYAVEDDLAAAAQRILEAARDGAR